MWKLTRTSIAALSVMGVLGGCAQTPPAPTELTAVPATKAGPDTTSCSRPVYPPQALANKIEGTSTIGLLIGSDGKVQNTRLYKSSGDASLDEAARAALALCTFKPALAKDKPVAAWAPVQYVWTLP
jgi:TonB family protein